MFSRFIVLHSYLMSLNAAKCSRHAGGKNNLGNPYGFLVALDSCYVELFGGGTLKGLIRIMKFCKDKTNRHPRIS